MFSDDIPSEDELVAARSEIFTETKKHFLAGDFSEEAVPFHTALLKSESMREMFEKCMMVITSTGNPLDVFACMLTFFMLGWKVGRTQMVKLDEKSLLDKRSN